MGFWRAVVNLDSGFRVQGLGSCEGRTCSALDINTRLGDFDASMESLSPVEVAWSLR
jgi:hypothetical protein